jgi:SPP1 gp7 family putative phage head morphogenesis protein
MTGDIDIVIKPDLTGVEALRINELARAETAQLYVTMGVPLNEVIEKLELPFDPVEGGDVPRAPAGTPAQEDDEDEDIEPAKSVRVKELKDAREQKRVKAWLEFDAKASRGQGRIETTMKNFFKGQEVRLIKGVTERLDQEKALGKKAHERAVEWLEVQFAVENEELTSKILPRIRSTYKSAGESAAKKRGASFNLLDPRAVEYLDDKRLRLAGQINRTTIDELKEAIQEGFEAGESIAKIADRLDEVYDFAESKRSERIARTESISASNGGTEEGMRQSGVSEKEWLSARDERVRDTHQKLDGNVVGVKEMFLSESGETLRFPGDPNADLSEIVNCRCTLIAAEEE